MSDEHFASHKLYDHAEENQSIAEEEEVEEQHSESESHSEDDTSEQHSTDDGEVHEQYSQSVAGQL